MLQKQLDLISEQGSPLFRIMWIHNIHEPHRRQFDNNISAFHIGNGFILSVAHNLKTEARLFKSIDNNLFNTYISPFLSPQETEQFNQWYPLDPATNKRYIQIQQQSDIQVVMNILQRINFDTRWLTLDQRNICKPYLIVQFKQPIFYEDTALTKSFSPDHYLTEPALNRHTFLLEIELVEAFYKEDIALYKIKNTSPEVIKRLPFIEADFSVLPDSCKNYYCLQSSPGGFLGRLFNKAQIEGYLDHHGIFADRLGGNFVFEGLRYLIKGYFRFGSSGAPYLFYDEESETFKVNAIQSEACPIQLSINNNREGNFQYINALASPLQIVETQLKAYLSTGKSQELNYE